MSRKGNRLPYFPQAVMKAIQLHSTGGPEVLQFLEVADPQAQAGEAVVRALAIGVGKPDVMIRTGLYPWMPPLPAIPGNEMVGIVESLEAAPGPIRVGQKVLVSSRELLLRGGCYAERIAVPAEALFALPEDMDPLSAVSLGNYQLANAMLFDSGTAPPRSILVQGAAGGVGTALVQTAAAHGIDVIAVASSVAKCAYARAAGAHFTHHRESGDLREAVQRMTDGRGVDLVLDPVAGPGFVSQLDLLAARGTLLSYAVLQGIPPDNLVEALRTRLDRSLAVRCYSVHVLDNDRMRRRDLMERAIELIAQGRVSPPAPTVFALKDAVAAHRLLQSPELLGKIALVP
jgi:NADPH:quinone reductase